MIRQSYAIISIILLRIELDIKATIVTTLLEMFLIFQWVFVVWYDVYSPQMYPKISIIIQKEMVTVHKAFEWAEFVKINLLFPNKSKQLFCKFVFSFRSIKQWKHQWNVKKLLRNSFENDVTKIGLAFTIMRKILKLSYRNKQKCIFRITQSTSGDAVNIWTKKNAFPPSSPEVYHMLCDCSNLRIQPHETTESWRVRSHSFISIDAELSCAFCAFCGSRRAKEKDSQRSPVQWRMKYPNAFTKRMKSEQLDIVALGCHGILLSYTAKYWHNLFCT